MVNRSKRWFTPWAANVLFLLAMCICINVKYADAAVRAPSNSDATHHLVSIPLLNVAEALNLLAEQTEALIMFPYDITVSRSAKAVSGKYSIMEALDLILQDSGLVADLSEKGVIQIRITDNAEFKSQERSEMKNKKNYLATVIAFIVGAGGTPHLLAQGEDKFFKEAEQLIEELLVVGTAASDENSTEIKRNATNIMDVLAADDIGSLPDMNVAEVFERIAGISTISQNADDEAEYVVIRGMESNTATFDGMGIASGSSSRKTNLESIPSGAIVRAEVNKSMSAKQDGQGLGGNINMGTRSAFSSDEMFLKIDMEGKQYSEDRAPISDVSLSPKVGVTYADSFGEDDQFGVVLAVQMDERSNEVIKYFTEYDWVDKGEEQLTAYPSKQPWASDRTGEYERQGGLVKFEYQTDDYYAFLSGFYFAKQEDIFSNRWILRQKGDVDYLEPGHAIIEKGESDVQERLQRRTSENTRIHFHFDTVINEDHAVNFDIAHGQAWHESTDIKWYFRTSKVEELGFEVNGRDNWTINDPEYFSNPENYKFKEFTDALTEYDNEITEAKLDWEFNTEVGENAWGASAGAKFRNNLFEKDNAKIRYKPNSNMYLDQFDTEYNYVPDGFAYVQPYAGWDTFSDYLSANPEEFSPYDEEKQIEENLKSDYVFEEDISSAYVQARYLTPRWSISGGLRVEHTSMESSSWTSDEDSDDGLGRYRPVENSASYTNVLPSINAVFNINDEWRVRLAASESIARPRPGYTHSGQVIERCGGGGCFDEDLGGEYSVKVKRNNSGLEPQESINTEISLEYYFDGGMASATVFQKDITGAPIKLYRLEENVAEYDGATVRYEERNNTAEREIEGVEINFKKRAFSFLPDALQGLGVSANATWLSGSEKYTDYLETEFAYEDLLNQPNRLANLTVYYSFMDGRGEAKLGYKYRGPNRINRKTNAYEDQYWAPAEYLDFQANYLVTDQLRIKLDVKNIKEEATVRKQGYGQELYRHDNQYGRAVVLGASYQF